MSTDPNDLSIEELEQLLEEKRRQQSPRNRFVARLIWRRNAVEQSRDRLAEFSAQHKPDVNLARIGHRVLLAVEITALLGLLVVVAAVYLQLQALNQETAQVMRQAARTPSTGALVAQETLPAASQPPSSFTPERFKGTLKQVVPVAMPTAGPQQPIRIVIPAVKVDALVVEGDDWEALKKGAGHHASSANPGQRGNLVISGHDDVFGEIFRYIGDLKADDEVIIYSQQAKFTYTVKTKRIVEPTEVSVLQQTTEPTLTLITCYPYLVDTQRLVVFAQLSN